MEKEGREKKERVEKRTNVCPWPKEKQIEEVDN